MRMGRDNGVASTPYCSHTQQCMAYNPEGKKKYAHKFKFPTFKKLTFTATTKGGEPF